MELYPTGQPPSPPQTKHFQRSQPPAGKQYGLLSERKTTAINFLGLSFKIVKNIKIKVTKIFTYWSFFIQNLVCFMDYRTRSANLKLTLSYPPLWYQWKVCFLKAIVSLFFKDCNLMEMSTSPWPVKSWMLSADLSPIRNSCGDKTRYLDWKENTLIWHMYGVIVSAFFG